MSYVGIRVNPEIPNGERRAAVFRGDILLGNEPSSVLRAWANLRLVDAFGKAPQEAQHRLPVEHFARLLNEVKRNFTHHDRTKSYVQMFLRKLGCDLDRTYFDLPRLRGVPSGDYLTAGVSYAYKPHRDTWWAHPICVVNFWMPVFDVTPECVMSFYPKYFHQPIRNSSARFDYADWVKNHRFAAVSQIKEDRRPHPLPLDPVDDAGEIRIAGRAGDLTIFSGAHLHATAPNTTGLTRFSVDFRIVHLDDLEACRGARNLDAACTGTTLGDYVRASDFTPLDLSKLDLARLHPPPEHQ